MTNNWVDIKNANVVLIMGSNAAENHPVAWKWIQAAKDNGATIIHVDPRFTRTSAKADIYAPIRSGTDIVFLGGMINYAINSTPYKINEQYVKDCTNALYLVDPSFRTARSPNPGYFSDWDVGLSKYATTTWDYQYAGDYIPVPINWAANTVYSQTSSIVNPTDTSIKFRYECIVSGYSATSSEPAWPTTIGSTKSDNTVTWRCCPPNPEIRKPLPTSGSNLEDTACVFQKLKTQYAAYTPDVVEKICGTPQDVFLQICKAYIDGTMADDKAGTMLYAMGWTQHTVGSQNIRAATIIQSLLGNMGVAGGGINALRGWHNVQGATDMGMLFKDIPGYNSLPKNIPAHAQLGVGPWDSATDYPNGTYLKKTIPLAMDRDAPSNPASSNWWGLFANQNNRARYVVSMLKAWWPTIDASTSWSYLPKRDETKDCSYLSLMKDIKDGIIKGLFCWGTNPAMMGPDQNLENSALDKLEWLVVCDLFETETSNFWKRGAGSSTTAVYLLPGAAFFEKKGSVANSSRLAQWKDTACPPPGNAKDELEIIADLGTKIKQYSTTSLGKDGILNLKWPYNSDVLTGVDLTDGVSKEINGYALTTFTTSPFYGGNYNTYTAGDVIDNFFFLMSGGQTACGNWLYCGTWGAPPSAGGTTAGAGNRMGGGANPSTLGRNPADRHPKTIGICDRWGYAWPQNRRIIYNRASVYQQTISSHSHGSLTHSHYQGAPLNPNKWVVWWDSTNSTVLTGPRWGGNGTGATVINDVIDGHSGDGPLTKMPFIMNEEGVARLMATTKPYGTALTDGAFPEHYEPWETPLNLNPLTGTGPLRNPAVSNWYSATCADQIGDEITYPIVCTTFRLSEHWHGGGMSRNLPGLAELQPEPFVEMSEELAANPGGILGGVVNSGDYVKIYSARNPVAGGSPVTVKACVTKRFKPFTINGTTIHEVGMPWHWGWVSSLTPACTGASANVLTPFIGDANTRIPETKAFLVKIVKVV